MGYIREYIQGLSRGDYIAVGFLVLSIFLYIVNPISLSLVLGNSMEPTFSHGDVVVYSSFVDMEEENMVVYKGEDGQTISHRLVDKRPEGYVAKGDNNIHVDDTLVTSKNYRGTILFHIDTSKYFPTDFLWKYYPD